jgi:hypothetical protein
MTQEVDGIATRRGEDQPTMLNCLGRPDGERAKRS